MHKFLQPPHNKMANESVIHVGGWNSADLSQNNVLFAICVITAVLHCLLWFQLFVQKKKFDLSFLFSLGYISTDVFLILSYFIQYTIRIQSWIPITRFSCYFEAYSMLYFNLLKSFCLTTLNICRYWQIVRNQNLYTVHRRRLLTASTIVLLLILANLIIQNAFGWCVVIEKAGASCSLSYTNIPVRVWNMTVVLFTPILISFYMVFCSLNYIKNTHAQQIMMRRNHHRQLMIHSLIFYSIWLVLWIPCMIVTYLDIGDKNEFIAYVTLVANTVETLIDPFLAIFLDKRFAQAWKTSVKWIQRQLDCLLHTRVHPAVELAAVR
jgi:hypothetical protein